MQNDIIRKLSNELAELIESERQVVYFLVEVRKLLESKGELDQWPSLKFHCDWVVHSKLSGQQAQDIVRKFDRYQQLNEALAQGQTPAEALTILADLDPILKLEFFRQELQRFLGEHDLDAGLATDSGRWNKFLSAYTEIISDCPLKCVSQGLQFTDEITLTPFDAKLEGTAYRLSIRWSWSTKQQGIECNTIRYY